MILNNYWKLTLGQSAQINMGGILNVNGEEYSARNEVSFKTALSTAYFSGGYGGTDSQKALFGDGDTPPTLSDFALSGNVITTLSGTVVFSSEVNTDNTALTLKAVYTLTNSGSDEVTIREAGLFRHTNTSLSSSKYTIMFERTVLDTPVTIPAGGVGQVEYTITFNLPTA